MNLPRGRTDLASFLSEHILFEAYDAPPLFYKELSAVVLTLSYISKRDRSLYRRPLRACSVEAFE
jgi:hypothetical protein